MPLSQVQFAQQAKALKLSELISALSHALDITEGQPVGHCVRCCWIGMHIGREIGLDARQLWELYYTLLLKDLGCSSNAARICELYLTDDLHFKQDFKRVGDSLPQVVRFVLQHTGLKAGLAERFKSVLNIFKNGPGISLQLIQTRCQRGAEIVWQHVAKPQLTMRPFSDAWLEIYLAAETEHLTTTVGAYRLEGPGLQLFADIQGDHSTIIGLPLLPLFTYLRQAGILGN